MNKIYQMDCIEALKQIGDKSIRCIFTDPPYNINYSYKEYKDNRIDYFEWCEEWLRECFSVLKDDGSIFVKQFSDNLLVFGNLMKKVGFIEKNVIIWTNKSQANPTNRFMKGYEVILFMSKSHNNYFKSNGMVNKRLENGWGKDRIAVGRYTDLWDDIKLVTAGNMKHPEGIYKSDSGEKVHSCQMPQGLVRRAILHTTDEGDIILDIFNGIGTTTAEAKLQNRNYIGIEISEYYNQFAIKRTNQMTVSDFWSDDSSNKN